MLSSSLDLYNTEQKRWHAAANMTTGRACAQVVVIDAQVLFVHGGARSHAGSRTAEWVDLASGVSKPAIASPARTDHTTLLKDGRLLVAGGNTSEGYLGAVSPTMEIWDPATRMGRFSTSPMKSARRGHSATLLRDGKVLLIGGYSAPGMASGAEIWDPISETSEVVAVPLLGRAGHSAAQLATGEILVVGGEQGAQPAPAIPGVVRLRLQPWSVEAVADALPAMESVAAVTSTGAILIFGGTDTVGDAVTTAMQVDSEAQALPSLPSPREGLSATCLSSGEVLILGGEDRGAIYSTGLLFS